MFLRFRAVTLWLVTAIMFVSSGVAFAQEAPNDRRVPSQTPFFMTIKDVAQFKDKLGQTSLGKLFRDPGMQPFLQEIHSKIADVTKMFESETGMSVEELASIPQGEITIALVIGPNPGQFSFVLFLNFRGKEESYKKVVDLIQKAQENNGQKLKEEEIEGHTVTLIPVEQNESPVKVAPAYCVVGSTMVFSSHTSALKMILARWDGKHDQTLAESESYKYISERCQGENSDGPVFQWFVDPMGIVKGALSVDPGMAFQAAMAMGVMQQIGVDKFKGLGGTVDMNQGDFDVVSRMFVMFEPTPRGIMNIFTMEEGAPGPGEWVAADVTGFSSSQWNLEKAYTTIEQLVDMFLGAGATARQLDELAENEALANFHVKKDLVDQFTGSYQVISDAKKKDDDLTSRTLVALELKNATAMKQVLARLAGIEGFPGKQREFQGETIYEFTLPDGAFDNLGIPNFTKGPRANARPFINLQAGGEDSGGERALGIAVVNKKLLIGFDVTIVEQTIRGLGDRERLSDSASYKQIAKYFPARATAISYDHSDANIAEQMDQVKALVAQQLANSGNEIDFDFAKLPSGEVLSKYLSKSGSFMENDSRGIRTTTFTLKKAD